MSLRRLKLLSLLLLLAVSFCSCGKKGPPVLAHEDFTLRVKDVKGEWKNGKLQLTGVLKGLKNTETASDLAGTCRVYYSKYALSDPPCDGCPIAFQGFYDFKSEDTIDEAEFTCSIPIDEQPHIYYFEIRLVSMDGALGSPSNRIKIETERCTGL